MIAVTFALPNESSDFVRLIANGRLHGHEVQVLHTGVGPRAACEPVARFLSSHRPHFVISSGFAGALTDTAIPGDVFLAENFSSPELLAFVDQNNVKVGRLETVDAILDSLGERAEVAKCTGATAVDMETKFIAEACARAGVKMLSLRAISDSPSAPFQIPPRILFDIERQRVPYGALFLHLFKHPDTMGKFLSLGKRIAHVRRSLTNALEDVVRRSGGLHVH